MPKTYKFHLRVREADEADFGRSIVRIHKNDKPQGILWGKPIDISLDKKNWVTCKLEPAGETGIGRIYIDVHTRGLINRHAIGIPIAKLHEACNFYIRKAIRWKTITFISIGAIVAVIILSLVYSLDLL